MAPARARVKVKKVPRDKGKRNRKRGPRCGTHHQTTDRARGGGCTRATGEHAAKRVVRSYRGDGGRKRAGGRASARRAARLKLAWRTRSPQGLRHSISNFRRARSTASLKACAQSGAQASTSRAVSTSQLALG